MWVVVLLKLSQCQTQNTYMSNLTLSLIVAQRHLEGEKNKSILIVSTELLFNQLLILQEYITVIYFLT